MKPNSIALLCLYITTALPLVRAETAKPQPTSLDDEVAAIESRTDLDPATKKLMVDYRRLRADKAKAQKQTTEHVSKVYGPIVDTLGLSPWAKERLQQLLIDRWTVQSDVNELLHDNKIQDQQSRDALLRQAKAEVDRDIESILQPAQLATVRKMIVASRFLSFVDDNYASSFELAKCPLTPEQRLELAFAMQEELTPSQNAAAAKRFELPLDAQGLTVVEEQLLTRLEKILTSSQLFIVRNELVIAQRRARQ